MAKILKDTELADIIRRAVHDPGGIDCADSYRHFLSDLGELVCAHFGGTLGQVVEPMPGELDTWTIGFHVNECVPADGGVFKRYDKDVTWKEGEEL